MTLYPTGPYVMHVRYIYKKSRCYPIMSEVIEELRRVSRRMMEEKEPYYKDTRKYLNTIMRSADQEPLISAIMQLNIHELKQCMAAGVPGDAMAVANARLKDLKAEIKAYIEKKGAEASASTVVETNPEEPEDELEGIRTSESGREGNSETLGKTSTDPRE